MGEEMAITTVKVQRRLAVSFLPVSWWSGLLTHLVLIVGALLMFYPAVWMLSASFKPSDEIFSDPGLWLTC